MIDKQLADELSRLHREQRLRAADQYRAAQAAKHEPQRPFYAPALAQLGETLTGIGTKLQERYRETPIGSTQFQTNLP